MNKSRRIGAMVALATASVGMATVTATAPAEASWRGPQPVSSWLRAVRAHTDSWVTINWRTDRRIYERHDKAPMEVGVDRSNRPMGAGPARRG